MFDFKHGSDLSKELGLLLLGTFLSLGSGTCICASEIHIYNLQLLRVLCGLQCCLQTYQCPSCVDGPCLRILWAAAGRYRQNASLWPACPGPAPSHTWNTTSKPHHHLNLGTIRSGVLNNQYHYRSILWMALHRYIHVISSSPPRYSVSVDLEELKDLLCFLTVSGLLFGSECVVWDQQRMAAST